MWLLVAVLSVGAATAVVTLTISRSRIFRPLRTWVAERSDFLYDLLECPYCLSHWVALGLTLIHGPLQGAFWVWAMAMVLAQVLMGIIQRSHDD